MSQAALATLEHDINSRTLEDKYNYYLIMLDNMQKAIALTVAEQMEIFGSIGKASLYER